MNKKSLIEIIKEDDRKPKIKGITIKMTEENYNKIKFFCKENNCKMSKILNIKINELIEEIEKYRD